MHKQNFWMRSAAFVFAAMLLITSAAPGQEKGPAKGQAKTFEGVVTDSMCGAQHGMMGNIPDKQCVLGCAKGGGYALIVGKKVYKLEGKNADFEKFAAEKVKVTGTLSGDTIKADSIAAAGK